MRRACAREGHRWVEYVNGFRLPWQFCSRWFCDARQVDPMLPTDVREALQRADWREDQQQQQGEHQK